MLELDHIVVTAPTLQTGVDHVRDLTGLEMPVGGEHLLMGTHNHLLRLGADEFLEVIAVNPAAPMPGRARWYGLDHPVQQPRLAHWVVRCRDMHAMRPMFPKTLGPAIPVTRGTLNWLLTVPEDGSLPDAGAMPSLIEWQTEPLPPTQMKGAGADLVTLTITHPEADRLEALLAPLLKDDRIRFASGPSAMEAEVSVNAAIVTLR